MNKRKHNIAAEQLERYLGDPLDHNNELSFNQALIDDEDDKFPDRLYQALNDWGLNEYYVPSAYGGRFSTFEELQAVVKTVSRRDLTAAIAHSSIYLGCAGIWVGGTEAQKQALADIVKNRGAVAFGLTEKEHGSDVLASEVRADSVAGGFLLNGQKWLINNASRSTAMIVFARTRSEGGPRGFSLFFVQKGGLDLRTYRHLPKIKTHGIRGADISGIGFDNCFIPSSSLIGAPGTGLELTLKTLQITRTMCAALSLGAANTALYTTIDFVKSRRLYGNNALALPTVQTVLVNAFVDILICDCMAAAAMRGLHVATNQFSVWSSIIKYFVPVTIDNAIRNLSLILGARYYLREGDQGYFQKTLRDNALVSLFDGNTAVNLHGIALQLRFLLSERLTNNSTDKLAARSRVETIFNLEKALPDFDAESLELFNHGRDDVLEGMQDCIECLAGLAAHSPIDRAVLDGIQLGANSIVHALSSLRASSRELTAERGKTIDKSLALFQLAEKYCALHAAAACLQIWIHNRQTLNPYFAKGEWLLLALNKLLTTDPISSASSMFDNAVQEVRDMHTRRQFISVTPFNIC